MNESKKEKDNEMTETLNSIMTVMNGLETLKTQFFEYELFMPAWNWGIQRDFISFLEGYSCQTVHIIT